MNENKRPAKVDIGLERIAFFCECWHPDHNFFVLYDTIEDEVTVQVKLNHWLPWYKRLWVALKYTLGITKPTGDYDEVILSLDDRKKLAGILLRTREQPQLPKMAKLKKLTK